MEILVFWDMTPSRLVVLTMEATISSENSVTVYRSTRRHILTIVFTAMTTWHLSRAKRNLSCKTNVGVHNDNFCSPPDVIRVVTSR
jgi:hypothetical protein